MARIGFYFARWRDQSTGLISQAKAAAWAREHATTREPARVYRFYPVSKAVMLCGETYIDRVHSVSDHPCRVSWCIPVAAPDVPAPAYSPKPTRSRKAPQSEEASP